MRDHREANTVSMVTFVVQIILKSGFTSFRFSIYSVKHIFVLIVQ